MLIRSLLAASLAALALPIQDDELLKVLATSKHTLLAGIQQVAKAPATPISAKFELEDGKLSLSVYAVSKGLGVDADHNGLQEYSGSPLSAAWQPEVEVFKDGEHIARAAQQLTLMSLSPASLVSVLTRVEKSHAGVVYSITPVVRDRQARFVVLVVENGKRAEVVCDLSGEEVKAKPNAAKQ
jgi:hypothetical protein